MPNGSFCLVLYSKVLGFLWVSTFTCLFKIDWTIALKTFETKFAVKSLLKSIV